MDLATVLGLVIAAIGILGGFTIEGGSMMGLVNLPGFFIVVVGTLGATMTAFPLDKIIAIAKESGAEAIRVRSREAGLARPSGRGGDAPRRRRVRSANGSSPSLSPPHSFW